jgi:DNA invertase Pin-like site-specific DNA recombinase
MKTGIILVRVSSRRQLDGTSPSTQEADCRGWLERQGARLLEGGVFRDEAESGKTMDREGLLAALEMVRARRPDYLVVWKLDRWARNTQEGLSVRAELGRHGCRLVSATEPISEDATGDFLATILLGVAQLDNEMRAARAKRAMRSVAMAGGWPLRAPIGWRHQTIGRHARGSGVPVLVPVDPPAGAIRAALEGLADGSMTLRGAYRTLGEIGVSPSAAARIFRQPIYGGIVQGPLTDGAPVRAVFGGLVSEDTWRCANARVRGYAQRGRPCEGDGLLSGVATCVSCGRRVRFGVSTGRGGRRFAYYDCRAGHVRARAADANLDLEIILRAQWTPAIVDIRAMVRSRFQEVAAHSRAARAAAAKRQQTAEGRLSRLADGWADGIIEAETYKERAVALRQEIAEARIDAAAHQDAIDGLGADLDRLVEALAEPLAMWRALPVEGRRRLAEIMAGGLVISEGGQCRTAKGSGKPEKVPCFDTFPHGAPAGGFVETARALARDVVLRLVA